MIDDNVVMLDGKIPDEGLHTLDFTHRAMIYILKLTRTRFPSRFNVIDDDVVFLKSNSS